MGAKAKDGLPSRCGVRILSRSVVGIFSLCRNISSTRIFLQLIHWHSYAPFSVSNTYTDVCYTGSWRFVSKKTNQNAQSLYSHICACSFIAVWLEELCKRKCLIPVQQHRSGRLHPVQTKTPVNVLHYFN